MIRKYDALIYITGGKMLFLKIQWIFPDQFFKRFIEIRNISKPALITSFGNRLILQKNFF